MASNCGVNPPRLDCFPRAYTTDFEILDSVCAGASYDSLYECDDALHHRREPIGWGLSRRVTCDFIADGIHLDPQMLRLLLAQGSDRFPDQ